MDGRLAGVTDAQNNQPTTKTKQDKQGRVHGHQGRICGFSHFSTHADGRTDGPTDGQSLLQSCVSATKKENCMNDMSNNNNNTHIGRADWLIFFVCV